mgnify:CR=1 FL=1
MRTKFHINNFVQFSERTTVNEHSAYALFDILVHEAPDNATYCQSLINKIIKLPYARLPDFFTHHCNFAIAPVKWLNKFEKLIADNEELFVSTTNRGRMIKCYTIIESKRKDLEQARYMHRSAKMPMQYVNAECETRYFSFKEAKNNLATLSSYTDKIIFLTKEKFDYEQADINFINPKLPDYSDQCQKQIDHIQYLNRLTDEFSIEQMQKRTMLPFSKLKINCNINQFVDVFYQLNRELFANGKPIVDGNINDLVAVIVNSFVDKNGKELSRETIRTILTPSKTDKRPKPHKKIDIDKML